MTWVADPLTLARDSRLGALSDEAGPQPASPARNIRLRNSARHGRDGRIYSDLSGDEVEAGLGTLRVRVPLMRSCVEHWPETDLSTGRRDDGRAVRCRVVSE